MAYIYKKTIGSREYYYLRASRRKGAKLVTKDIAYLGSSLDEVRQALTKLPEQEVRAAYKTLNRFLETNHWLEKSRALKLKRTPYLERSLFENIEACRLHWQELAQRRNVLTRRDYFKRFVIEFAYNTTGIEGNTITLKEVWRLLTEQRTPKDKTVREIHDVQNTERVFLDMVEQPPALTHESITGMHRELMRNVDARIGYRTGDVHVVHARFASTPAQYVKTDMDLLLRWYHEHRHQLHPLVLAAIVHHQFEKIHPFFDGNGRTGRMLLNAVLLEAGYPPLVVRKRTRDAYLEALAAADRTGLAAVSPEHYNPLVDFLAVELINSYWNIFL